MYGGGQAESNGPSAKKQRVDHEYNRVRRDTFVESMLFSVSSTLAGDAEYGYNPANRIRRRVESITSQIDDQSPDALRSSSRAVLESRFALGFDDGQYLSQAVSLLWAGDGGERLRIAPLNSMPEIMRIASAKGMIYAMGDVVQRQKKDATTSINRALRLAAWLMQIEIVRGAILDVLRFGEGADPAAEEVHTILSEAFRGGMALEDGSNAVLALMEHPNGMRYSRAVVCAFLVVMQPSSTPNAIFQRLQTAMNETVVRTERDVTELFDVAVAMDGAGGRTMTSFDPNSGVGLGSTDGSVCTTREMYKNQIMPSSASPTFAEFCTSVKEAVSRISASHKSLNTTSSNVTTAESPSAGGGTQSDEEAKGWYLHSILSPMWKATDRAAWDRTLNRPGAFPDDIGGFAPPRTPLSNEDASQAMSKVVKNANLGRRNFGSKISSLASNRLDGKLNQDEAFVQFAMIRGLCGYRGIHQTEHQAEHEVVKYDYPTNDLNGYKKGEFVEQPEANLSDGTLKLIYSVESSVYSTENLQLDTDFFGNATYVDSNSGSLAGSEYHQRGEARKARWLPVIASRPGNPFEYDTYSQVVCEASVYEFMALSLYKPSVESDDPCKRAMVGAAAVAKLRQLECAAVVESKQPSEGMLYGPESMRGDVYVTRPCMSCRSGTREEFSHDDIAIPVDAGVARIYHKDASSGPFMIKYPELDELNATGSDKLKEPYYTSNIEGVSVFNDYLSVCLSNGMQTGWNAPPQEGGSAEGSMKTLNAAEARPRPFSLFVGASADAQPVEQAPLGAYAVVKSSNTRMLPDDLCVSSMFNVFANSVDAMDRLEQIECEENYVERFKIDGSEEQQRVFGLHKSIEDATRDRRADLWTDAVREVAISGDRLYRFVTELTGAIGEAADSAISWEDEDLKALAKEASAKQKSMADRVSRFQTKLVENVVSSTLRASKLQLDVRDRGDAANELVVVNTEVKEGIRQITSGEAGHGFFEASVELGNLLGTVSKPITIKDLVKRLHYVSMEFQEQLQNSMAVSAPMSYSRVAEPRNSFMMHLKADTVAAIHKAFDLITSELRVCPGYHRHVYLWEYVEGKDWVLSSRFAELTGLMLQNTRMRSGSFAAYVGTAQIITNTQNVRMQIQRLKTQVCSYLMSQDTPQFLSPSGRTAYFGGTMTSVSTDVESKTSAQVKNAVLGKTGGFYDNYWGSVPNPKQQGPKQEIMRTIKEVTSRIVSRTYYPNVLASSMGHGLDTVAMPQSPRNALGGNQGQVMASAHRLMADSIKQLNFNEVLLLMKACLQASQAGAASRGPHDASPDGHCSQHKSSGRHIWLYPICTQLESAGVRKNMLDVSEKCFAEPLQQSQPEHSPQRPDTQYYVVRVLITSDMLQANGVSEQKIKWNTEKGRLIKSSVSYVLKELFQYDQSETTRAWVPHSRWEGVGYNGPFAGTWLLEVSSDDSTWRDNHNLMLRLSNYFRVALGVPFEGNKVLCSPSTAVFLIAAMFLAVLVGVPETIRTVATVSSNQSGGVLANMSSTATAPVTAWTSIMSSVSARFTTNSTLMLASSKDSKTWGNTWEEFRIITLGKSYYANSVKAVFDEDCVSNEQAISSMKGVPLSPSDEKMLETATQLQKLLKQTRPVISQLQAHADSGNTELFNEARRNAFYCAWRDTNPTLTACNQDLMANVEDPAVTALRNSLGGFIQTNLSMVELADEAARAMLKLTPADQATSFKIGLDELLKRQDVARKQYIDYLPRWLKSGESSLAPIDMNDAVGIQFREATASNKYNVLCDVWHHKFQSALNDIAGRQPTAEEARQLAFFAMVFEVVASRYSGSETNAALSPWNATENLAAMAFVQWDLAVLTKFQLVLAPTMDRVVSRAKRDGATVSQWMLGNKRALIDLISSNPLVSGNQDLAKEAAEILNSPVLINSSPAQSNIQTQFYDQDQTTIPRSNYLRFFSLMLGSTVYKIGEQQIQDQKAREIYESYRSANGVDQETAERLQANPSELVETIRAAVAAIAAGLSPVSNATPEPPSTGEIVSLGPLGYNRGTPTGGRPTPTLKASDDMRLVASPRPAR